MCVSTCHVEFVLRELSFFILLPRSRFTTTVPPCEKDLPKWVFVLSSFLPDDKLIWIGCEIQIKSWFGMFGCKWGVPSRPIASFSLLIMLVPLNKFQSTRILNTLILNGCIMEEVAFSLLEWNSRTQLSQHVNHGHTAATWSAGEYAALINVYININNSHFLLTMWLFLCNGQGVHQILMRTGSLVFNKVLLGLFLALWLVHGL